MLYKRRSGNRDTFSIIPDYHKLTFSTPTPGFANHELHSEPTNQQRLRLHDIDSLVLYSRVDINSQKVERVANLEQTRGLHAGRFGTYYGVTPDGSPLFLRNTGFQEIYALDVDLP